MGKKKGGGPGARFATDPKERVRACVGVIPRTDGRTNGACPLDTPWTILKRTAKTTACYSLSS